MSRGGHAEGLTLVHTAPNQVRHFFCNSCLVTALDDANGKSMGAQAASVNTMTHSDHTYTTLRTCKPSLLPANNRETEHAALVL